MAKSILRAGPLKVISFLLFIAALPGPGFSGAGSGVSYSAGAAAALLPADQSGGSTIPSDAGDHYFPETRYTVPGVFMRYWNAHGGLAVFGYPISPARAEVSRTDEKQYTVQYFERNRFEWHPELRGTPYEVLLGLLGNEVTQAREFDRMPAGTSNSPMRVVFPQTSHSLADSFLRYWQQYGGLAVFGYPISEAFEERNTTDGKTYLTQYFERNRFEYHPENKGTRYEVLLGLLGYDSYAMRTTYEAWGPEAVSGPKKVYPVMPPTKPAYPPGAPISLSEPPKWRGSDPHADGIITQMFYTDYSKVLFYARDLKMSWVKQQVEWRDIESPKGTYYWGELDKVVDAASDDGFKVMLSVAKSPSWANPLALPGVTDSHGFPSNPQDLADFMSALASRYKGRVSAYEIWNEQNLTGEAGVISPSAYVKLLEASYMAIKRADADAVVVTGGLSPTGVTDPEGHRAPAAMGVMNDTRYLEEMYKYNEGEVRSYFDVLGMHPYGFNNPPDTSWPTNPNLNPELPKDPKTGQVDYYNRSNSFYFRRLEEHRAIMERYGDAHKQMWLTEVGWCSDYRPDGYGECNYNTEDEVGQYILAAMTRARKYYPWMGAEFIWNLNFSTVQEWYTGPSHFSLVNPDWTPRQQYQYVKWRPWAATTP